MLGPSWLQVGPGYPKLAQLGPDLALTWPELGPNWSSSCTWRPYGRKYQKPRKTYGFASMSGAPASRSGLRTYLRTPRGPGQGPRTHFRTQIRMPDDSARTGLIYARHRVSVLGVGGSDNNRQWDWGEHRTTVELKHMATPHGHTAMATFN